MYPFKCIGSARACPGAAKYPSIHIATIKVADFIADFFFFSLLVVVSLLSLALCCLKEVAKVPKLLMATLARLPPIPPSSFRFPSSLSRHNWGSISSITCYNTVAVALFPFPFGDEAFDFHI